MAGHETDARADALAHLVTEQDVHAFVDGALPAHRRRAVEAFVARRLVVARQAASDLRATLALRAARDVVYQDEALRAEVERLMAKREARRTGADAVARRAGA